MATGGGVGDINGDGRSDLVQGDAIAVSTSGATSVSGTLSYRASTGLGLATETNIGSYTVGCEVVVAAYSVCDSLQALIGDVNGDAIDDIITFNEHNSTGPRVRLAQTPGPDLLLSVTDGISNQINAGPSVSFEYATLMDTSVYTVGSASATFPERIIRDTTDTRVVKKCLLIMDWVAQFQRLIIMKKGAFIKKVTATLALQKLRQRMTRLGLKPSPRIGKIILTLVKQSVWKHVKQIMIW